MVFLALLGVLRGVSGCGVLMYASPELGGLDQRQKSSFLERTLPKRFILRFYPND